MILSLGQVGAAPREWQRFLTTVAADGDFGEFTAAATRTFQLSRGLPPTGEADADSRATAAAEVRADSRGQAWPWLLHGSIMGTVNRKWIDTLHATLQGPARHFLALALDDGLVLRITSGYRSSETQARLYAQGRTAPGPRVTGAAPGYSWHQHRLALDTIPVDEWGRPNWMASLPELRRMVAHGEAAGLQSGSHFKYVDFPHFQRIGGLNIQQALGGMRPAQ